MLILVSTLFVVVRFDKGVGLMKVIIYSLKQIVLSFFGEDTDHDSTTNVLMGYGQGRFLLLLLVDTINTLAHINCLTTLCSK